jgi:hypothetical protein
MSVFGLIVRCCDKRLPIADTDGMFGFRMVGGIFYYIVCHPYVWLFFSTWRLRLVETTRGANTVSRLSWSLCRRVSSLKGVRKSRRLIPTTSAWRFPAFAAYVDGRMNCTPKKRKARVWRSGMRIINTLRSRKILSSKTLSSLRSWERSSVGQKERSINRVWMLHISNNRGEQKRMFWARY